MEQEPNNSIFTLHEQIIQEENEQNNRILTDILGTSLIVTSGALATFVLGDLILDKQFSHALQNMGQQKEIASWLSAHLDNIPTMLKAFGAGAMYNVAKYLLKE